MQHVNIRDYWVRGTVNFELSLYTFYDKFKIIPNNLFFFKFKEINSKEGIKRSDKY